MGSATMWTKLVVERKAKVLADVRGGEVDQTVLCQRYGISYPHLRNILREAGVKIPRQAYPKGTTCYAIIAELFDAKQSYADVANKLETSVGNVANVAHLCFKHGVPIPHRERGRHSASPEDQVQSTGVQDERLQTAGGQAD